MGGVTINFNDTSEYMFRNSSTQKGGFEGNVGTTWTDTDIDITGTEDVSRSQELLTGLDRTQLRSQIDALEACAVTSFCSDKSDLITRAGNAWDRALALYPTFKSLLDTQTTDLKEEILDQIYLMRSQWARTAGSSLNCLVQEMESDAQVELARRVAGVVAEQLRAFKEHETEAIRQAFEMQFAARAKMAEIGLSSMNTLWNILRGAEVQDITDRDYTENRDEDTNTINLLGKFYHEGIDISDSDGSYALAGDAVSASQAIANLIPTS